MMIGKHVVHAFFGLSVALQIGCSTDAEIPVSSDTNDTASPAAALPNQTFQSNSNPEYTGEVLADGTVVLNWPMDPEATGYSIYRDNTKVAQVSSDDLSFTDTNQLLNDATLNNTAENTQQTGRRISYEIFSVTADNQERIWVDQLEVVISSGSETLVTASEESVNGTPDLGAANPDPDVQPNIPTTSVDPDPVIPAPAVPAPVDPEPLVPAPVDPEPFVPAPAVPDPVEPAPVEPDPVEPEPVEPEPVEPEPVEPDPVEPEPVEPEPVEPEPVEPVTNISPIIDSISLGCDWVLESIAIEAGVATNFTLFVDDESPLTLSYSAISDDTSIVDVSVDSNGVFTVLGNDVGNTTISIVVTDDQGLQDQMLLSVVSEI